MNIVDFKEQSIQKPKPRTKKIYYKRNYKFNPKNNQDLMGLFSVMLAKNEEIERKNLTQIAAPDLEVTSTQRMNQNPQDLYNSQGGLTNVNNRWRSFGQTTTTGCGYNSQGGLTNVTNRWRSFGQATTTGCGERSQLKDEGGTEEDEMNSRRLRRRSAERDEMKLGRSEGELGRSEMKEIDNRFAGRKPVMQTCASRSSLVFGGQDQNYSMRADRGEQDSSESGHNGIELSTVKTSILHL